MAGLREHHKQDRRSRILRAARMHVCQRGYGSTTVETIAETAGVSAVTVFNHYGTKGGLLLALVAESDDLLVAKIEDLVRHPPGDVVRAVIEFARIIRAHALAHLGRSIWRQVIATSIIEGDSDFGRGYAELDRRLAAELAAMLGVLQGQGRIPAAADTAALGAALFKLQDARFVEFVADPGLTEDATDALLRRDLEVLLAALRSERDG